LRRIVVGRETKKRVPADVVTSARAVGLAGGVYESMKAIILAGGLGTRLSEETASRPKPMVDIGGRPMLWHIMKIYSHYGIDDFVICCGYRGHVIKEFFANYALNYSDVTFDLRRNSMQVHQNSSDNWRVTLVDTGEHTQTGGRLKRVQRYVDADEPFCLTYGDAVADIDITKLIAFHQAHGRLATVTAVQPVGRFGCLKTAANGSSVRAFEEKPAGDGGWISGGFFVLSPKVIDYIDDDMAVWERQPLHSLVSEGELEAYRHTGFWQCMDTQRDKSHLEELWQQDPPWKKW
jgi:glucose-1-phosphate cytidylyltransferase